MIEQGDGESYDITLTPQDWEQFEGEIEVFPKEVLFSKSGTYMIYYADQSIGISSWKWKTNLLEPSITAGIMSGMTMNLPH